LTVNGYQMQLIRMIRRHRWTFRKTLNVLTVLSVLWLFWYFIVDPRIRRQQLLSVDAVNQVLMMKLVAFCIEIRRVEGQNMCSEDELFLSEISKCCYFQNRSITRV
jgi:hypothetical protein